MMLLFFLTTAVFFVAFVWSEIGRRLYKDLFEIGALEHKELRDLEDELVEHVMDGRDFDAVEAVIIIRQWKELASEWDELRKSLALVEFIAEHLPAETTEAEDE